MTPVSTRKVLSRLSAPNDKHSSFVVRLFLPVYLLSLLVFTDLFIFKCQEEKLRRFDDDYGDG